MKYISVTAPSNDKPGQYGEILGNGLSISKAIFNYFKQYLVSFGEVARNNQWNSIALHSHMKKIIEEKPKGYELYIDSGGFQIIMQYITNQRIPEFINVYHDCMIENRDKIEKIFSLDVFNSKMNEKQVRQYNTYSIQSSIEAIKKYPEIADKQLFVLQTSSFLAFKIWRNAFLKQEVYKYYKLWSIGGLVGLKKRTNAKFSHAVPATLWLLTYQKHFNFTINQVHWLGQSSRLSFISMGLFERLYGINMTSDSSALVRFAPLDQKLPLIHKHNDDFELAIVPSDTEIMLKNHSFDLENSEYKHIKDDSFCKESYMRNREMYKKKHKKIYPEEYNTRFEYAQEHYKLENKLDDTDMAELQAQGVYFEIEFANYICDKIIKIGIENINSKEQLMELHPILKRGRTANELMNNIIFFKKFKDIIESGNLNAADAIMVDVVKGYEIKSE